MKEKITKEKLYFQDFPVKNYEDDFVGFEAEVEMIKESVESDSKIIGLISEYGSGKSSIIELLKNNLDTEKYDVVNINLLDPDGNNSEYEAHKRMLLQLANHKYAAKKDEKKLSHITKRLNPNYKSVDISTTDNISIFFIVSALLLFAIKFLYANGLLSYINFLPYPKYSNIINFIKNLCNLSGIIGFVILFFTIIRSEIICNYLKNGDSQSLNEFDLIEISKKLIDPDKITVIIIEDFERMNNSHCVEEFIKELNTYYKSMDNCKFIIALTPKDFYNMSLDKGTNKVADSKYKPFNMVINLPNIKNSDYKVILNKLLLSKKEIFKKSLNLDIEKSLECWSWLSFGSNMNIRRLKHRVNSVIHLYNTLKNRFPGKHVELKTCIAIAYLKDEYEIDYEKLINNEKNEFELKNKVEKYINGDIPQENIQSVEQDLYKLVKSGYIDYNCEMYCFNYSKYNKIFDVYEDELINDLMYDRKIELEDLKVESIIKNNSNCIKEILKKRLSLNMGLPTNIFDSKPLIDYLYTSEKGMVKVMCDELLPINYNHIKGTISRISKMKGTNFFNEDNLKQYIEEASKNLQEDGDIELINQIRLYLLDVIPNPLVMKKLYENDYSIITKEEIRKIGSLSTFIELIDYDKLNINNISYIVEMLDELYKEKEREKIIEIVDNFSDEIIDYYFKNCKSLSNLKEIEKNKLLTENENRFNLTSLDEIERIIKNINYSTEKIEDKVIKLLDSEAINISQYKEFVNILPNVHECTLNRLKTDEFVFKTSEIVISEYKKNKDYYGYVKYRTLNDEQIPTNKKYNSQFEALYSNRNGIFDKYIIKSIDFLKYICNNKIYEKYDDQRFKNMSYCPQTFELLSYAFEKLEGQLLNTYISSINSITCNKDELSRILTKNEVNIKSLSLDASVNLIKCCDDRSIKSKLAWIRRK